MKNQFLIAPIIIILLLLFNGCDSVYRYVFVPSERVELTMVPNVDFIKSLNDTTLRISKDGNSIIIDKKDYKIELKYISDYQLNNFEFPEDSKGEEFSKNPFTYGNWIDPNLGYTPNRFSVFKISIYNYTFNKINFNPEDAILETDRGDKYKAYGREKKDSKNQSLEEYYLKRKGASGLDDEVFESRMGIARRTMVFLGKPIYAGDSKEGFIVFDPVVESVEYLKVTLNKFILGYDENNDPTNFADFTFNFKRVPFDKSIFDVKIALDTTQKADDKSAKDKQVDYNVIQLQYNSSQTHFQGEVWNPYPNAIPNLLDYCAKDIKFNTKFNKNIIDEKVISDAKLLIMFGGFAKPDFNTTMVQAIANYLSKGGFLFIDNAYVSNQWPYLSTMKDFLTQVSSNITGKVEIKKVPMDHEIFTIKKKFISIPKGFDDYNKMADNYDYVEGLFIDNKLVAVLSSKGYLIQWVSQTNNEEALDFGKNIVAYTLKKK